MPVFVCVCVLPKCVILRLLARKLKCKTNQGPQFPASFYRRLHFRSIQNEHVAFCMQTLHYILARRGVPCCRIRLGNKFSLLEHRLLTAPPPKKNHWADIKEARAVAQCSPPQRAKTMRLTHFSLTRWRRITATRARRPPPLERHMLEWQMRTRPHRIFWFQIDHTSLIN